MPNRMAQYAQGLNGSQLDGTTAPVDEQGGLVDVAKLVAGRGLKFIKMRAQERSNEGDRSLLHSSLHETDSTVDWQGAVSPGQHDHADLTCNSAPSTTNSSRTKDSHRGSTNDGYNHIDERPRHEYREQPNQSSGDGRPATARNDELRIPSGLPGTRPGTRPRKKKQTVDNSNPTVTDAASLDSTTNGIQSALEDGYVPNHGPDARRMPIQQESYETKMRNDHVYAQQHRQVSFEAWQRGEQARQAQSFNPARPVAPTKELSTHGQKPRKNVAKIATPALHVPRPSTANGQPTAQSNEYEDGGEIQNIGQPTVQGPVTGFYDLNPHEPVPGGIQSNIRLAKQTDQSRGFAHYESNPTDTEAEDVKSNLLTRMPVRDSRELQGLPSDLLNHTQSQDDVGLHHRDPNAVPEDEVDPNHITEHEDHDASIPRNKRPRPDTSLDYDAETLFEMRVEQLQNESFDHEPNNESSVQDGQELSCSIETGMQNMLDVSADQPQQYLHRLSQQEWEQAGEWLVSKFTEVTKNLVESRNKRRAIAQRFEQEIARRHDEIVEQRGELENDLRDMREKGEALMTPKKKGNDKAKSHPAQ